MVETLLRFLHHLGEHLLGQAVVGTSRSEGEKVGRYEHCARCKAVSSGLRATREVGTLPLVDPPEGLELGILEAERKANARLPLRKKLGRGVSILAVYAMRPQLAMAALLLLMIGSSLFFLRGQPGASQGVLVTERGTPEAEAEHVAILPAPERRGAPAASAMPKAAGAKGDAVASRERSRPLGPHRQG